MIARLTGLVDGHEADRCVIDVGGVGYLVFASSRTLTALPAPPERAQVLVETQVREDAIALYGFADAAERDWFRVLTGVQGIGGRVALGLLSALSPAELSHAVQTGDKARLTAAPGVGAKLAARMVTELKDKAPALPTGGTALPVSMAAGGGAAADALSALLNLGYRRPEAQRAVAGAADGLGAGAGLDALVRAALKELMR